MRKRDQDAGNRLIEALIEYSTDHEAMPGIADECARLTFVEQLIESIRRVKYLDLVQSRSPWQETSDPSSPYFDAVKAAVVLRDQGNIEDAFWMVFLFAHFGKNRSTGWRLIADVYGRLGDGRWDWGRVSANPTALGAWIAENFDILKRGKFGNHRKYETLSDSPTHGTSAVVISYVNWVSASHSHQILFDRAIDEANGDGHAAFDMLYHQVKHVRRFGRIGSFDYLAMISNLRLAEIAPGSPYLVGATGPLYGARLLFHGDRGAKVNSKTLEQNVISLGSFLSLGMQVMEDAMCNWQKSPSTFIPFRA